MKKVLGILACALLSGFAGTAQAMLADRGMVGSGAESAHMIYDTDRNITWLDVASGLMSRAAAVDWAANGAWGGYNNWRLPTALNPDGSGPCSGFECTGSEMGHLFYKELGGVAFSSISDVHNSNYDLFNNLQSSRYWSGTEIDPSTVWVFGNDFGDQALLAGGGALLALAVRDGDVGAPSTAPIPAAAWLFGSALAWLGATGRRERQAAPLVL
jgi:hypothetical protein